MEYLNYYEDFTWLNESAKSDEYEREIADYINNLDPNKCKAERPKVGTGYSDVRLTVDNKEVWLEVKMNHTDNIGNPRVYYSDEQGGWNSTYKTPAAKFCVDMLNESPEAKKWMDDFKKWLCKKVQLTDDEKLKEIVKSGTIKPDNFEELKAGVNKLIKEYQKILEAQKEQKDENSKDKLKQQEEAVSEKISELCKGCSLLSKYANIQKKSAKLEIEENSISKDNKDAQKKLAEDKKELIKLAAEYKKEEEDSELTPDKLSIILPTTSGGLKLHGAVPLEFVREYAEEKGNRYIMRYEGDITELVTSHYLNKTEPAYYIQAGDDLYKIGNKNPLGWPVPLFVVKHGTCHIRISTRSKFYEIQSEIKIKEMEESKYSLKPGSKKEKPF